LRSETASGCRSPCRRARSAEVETGHRSRTA
jgi:hypothetical protein